MATKKESDKKNLMHTMFRRSSSAEAGDTDLFVDNDMIPTILNRMGQKVSEVKVKDYINREIDIEHTGHLDYNKFTKVCEKFLTDPAILDKVKGDDFSFKHLIHPDDFYNP